MRRSVRELSDISSFAAAVRAPMPIVYQTVALLRGAQVVHGDDMSWLAAFALSCKIWDFNLPIPRVAAAARAIGVHATEHELSESIQCLLVNSLDSLRCARVLPMVLNVAAAAQLADDTKRVVRLATEVALVACATNGPPSERAELREATACVMAALKVLQVQPQPKLQQFLLSLGFSPEDIDASCARATGALSLLKIVNPGLGLPCSTGHL
eukprot:gnl/Chilomastix_cuspidata/4562.p1 GENE.gnl/Chilomastix_cuspidata/4562~~gnl/Chilomastix_cuspidata/4562.p1  ORF type:complete len:212 (-),score=36.23 gnl/Chilomastix_cuspidata/4562:380-1015(-)